MSKTDTVYVRELLELSGARDLYEDLGVEPSCSRVELVAALERKREWARRFPDDPVARWWTRHMVRTARLLVHDEAAAPKRKRQDDLQAAIKGAVLQGTLGPEMRRLVIRMGERRGLDGEQVDAMIDHERKALESLQKKIGTALGKSPDDEAKEAVRAAMWGAMVAGNASSGVVAKIVERGCALGLDADTVRKVIDEVKGDWKVERAESLDTDLEGRWVPPHRRVQRDDTRQRAPSEGGEEWALSDSLEDGLDDVVRNARDEREDLPEIELDPSAGILPEDPTSESVSRERWRPHAADDDDDRNAITGASHVLSVRAIPANAPPVIIEKPTPTPVRRVEEAPSSTTLSSPPEDSAKKDDAKAKAKARSIATHTLLATMAVFGGAFYGVTWFLLAHRSHLF
jgi:hypothetical protein